MAITQAPLSPDSDAVRDANEKELQHQEIENTNMVPTPTTDEDPNAGKLTKETILAYIVSGPSDRLCL
jgi:hypothetical protein